MKLFNLTKQIVLSAALFAVPMLCAAEAVKSVDDEPTVIRPEINIVYTQNLTPENALKHNFWNTIPGYRFYVNPYELEELHRAPREGATVKLAYDSNYLYVRAEMDDSDVLTTGTENQSHLYLMGDLLEVFIKPLNDSYYWEIYGTPNKLFSCFYFPSRAYLGGIPSIFGPTDVVIPVDAKVNGTFNKCDDRDNSWTSLIAVPRKVLEKNGLKFDKGSDWTIFISRYNYSRFLSSYETSSFPQITGSFHSLAYYANVNFVKDKNGDVK
jgi:hypothetical protein